MDLSFASHASVCRVCEHNNYVTLNGQAGFIQLKVAVWPVDLPTHMYLLFRAQKRQNRRDRSHE